MKGKKNYKPLEITFVQLTEKSVVCASLPGADNDGGWLWGDWYAK